jgi:anaerobic selenocysteine-containing dehydrogenase
MSRPMNAVRHRCRRRRRYTPPVGQEAGDELGAMRCAARRSMEARKPLPKSYVRLTQPLVRDTKDGELRPATWDEALDRTVAAFRAAGARTAPDGQSSIGIFSCSRSTNEVNFAAQKLSRVVLGSNNIDSCNRT